jgi:hypothetical protein
MPFTVLRTALLLAAAACFGMTTALRPLTDSAPHGMVMLCFYNSNNCSGTYICRYSPLEQCNFVDEFNVTDVYTNCTVPKDGSHEVGYFVQQTYYGNKCDGHAEPKAREMKIETGVCSQGQIALCVNGAASSVPIRLLRGPN